MIAGVVIEGTALESDNGEDSGDSTDQETKRDTSKRGSEAEMASVQVLCVTED